VTRCVCRTIDTPEELAEVEALQRIVWPGDDLEIVPAHVLLTAAHNGGLVAGAWAGERLAGFVFGFLGFHESETARCLKHCSHMLGVHPDFRSAGVGYALKTYQREHVLRQGIDLITWTYDPLLARNAQLNIAKLGAMCNTYLANLYGEMRDNLNAGLPSDRFRVDWWIATQRVADRLGCAPGDRPRVADLAAGGAVRLNAPGPDGTPQPPDSSSAVVEAGATVLVEIPADFLALKAVDPALALRWRLGTRAAFQRLFRQGYGVTDFVHAPDRGTYVLSHESQARAFRLEAMVRRTFSPDWRPLMGATDAKRRIQAGSLSETRFDEKLKTLMSAQQVLAVNQLPQPVRQYWPDAVTAKVILMGERRAHYLTDHADIAPYEDRLRDVIANPDEIHRNKRDAQIAILYQRIDEDHWLRATLWISDKPGLQNSIHSYRLAGVEEVRKGRRSGRLLWQK